MRKFILATLSAAALGLVSQASFAADVEVDPVAYDWSGLYVGVTAGYGWGDVQMFDDGAGTSGKQDVEGFVAGGTLGYNYQMDSFLIGVETDLSFSDIDGSWGDQPGWNCANVCTGELDWFGTARLRLGLPMDSFLPYVTGGLAIGGLQSDMDVDTDFSLDETEIGWTIGGGIEGAVSENLTLKAEVLYMDFGNTEDDGSADDFNIDSDFVIGRVGLNFQF